jgi:hypothetical protein
MLGPVMSGSALSFAPVCALALTLGLCACGLRSDPDPEEDSGDTVSDTEDDPRRGGCDMPFVLPFANTLDIRGRLLGPGKVRGWCGQTGEDEPDAGPEDSYVVTPSFDVDAVVSISEADFEPSIRVTRDGCREDVLAQMCAAPIDVGASRHFFAQVGHSYTITVDSPEGTDGHYKMQVLYGDPGIGACPIHPSQIDQAPGGYFTWSNTFGATQGEVDGRCGGPGDENMFQVNVLFPGTMTFRVTADASFAPVLSLRSGCGGVTELQCTSAEESGSNTVEIVNFFPSPGTFYIVVDQGDVVGGSYKLEVFSE